MPFKQGARQHLLSIRSSLNQIIKTRISNHPHDFNISPANAIMTRLQTLIGHYTDSDDKLTPDLAWIAYHVGMIVNNDGKKYIYGPCPQPLPNGYNGDVVEWWLDQISNTLNTTAPNLLGQKPTQSGDPLEDIDSCLSSIPAPLPSGVAKHVKNAVGKS